MKYVLTVQGVVDTAYPGYVQQLKDELRLFFGNREYSDPATIDVRIDVLSVELMQ